MWRRSAFLALFLALVASVDAQSGPNGKILPPDMKVPQPKDPLFNLDTSMATKTAYWNLRTDKRGVFKAFEPKRKRNEESMYTLLQIQQIVRHGGRYPTKSNMKEIQKLLTKIQKHPDIPSWLKGYKLPYDLSLEGLLSPSGSNELQEFGTRVRKAVGSAMPMSFSSEKFVLQHTFKSRTKYSAMAFASTFFDNPLEVVYDAHTEGSDRLLRFFDECPRYQREVKENTNATIELTRYVGMKGVTDNIEVLRAKLNLPASADLTVGDVQTAYSACSFDLALNDRYDNWCSLMTEEMVKEVEFGEDLETFYEESHGYKINYEMAAVLLKDIHQNMKDLIDRKSSVIGNFRFAHGETTMPLLTLLGLVDKTRLTADMPPREIDARKFRTSRLALFMANIEFRLYKPKTGPKNLYFVQVRVNEQPMEIPDCEDTYCELTKFERVFKQALTVYDFDKDCGV